jgi:hypothetical protein
MSEKLLCFEKIISGGKFWEKVGLIDEESKRKPK